MLSLRLLSMLRLTGCSDMQLQETDITPCAQLFCDEERPRLKAAVPEAKFGELNGLLAAKWKGAAAADKERFHKMCEVCHPLSMPDVHSFIHYTPSNPQIRCVAADNLW